MEEYQTGDKNPNWKGGKMRYEAATMPPESVVKLEHMPIRIDAILEHMSVFGAFIYHDLWYQGFDNSKLVLLTFMKLIRVR